MIRCVFKHCICTSRHRRQGVVFYEFPVDEAMRSQWIDMVREDLSDLVWMPKSNSRVCSMHFAKQDYHPERVLKDTAFPIAKYEMPNYLRLFRRQNRDEETAQVFQILDGVDAQMNNSTENSCDEHNFLESETSDDAMEQDEPAESEPPAKKAKMSESMEVADIPVPASPAVAVADADAEDNALADASVDGKAEAPAYGEDDDFADDEADAFADAFTDASADGPEDALDDDDANAPAEAYADGPADDAFDGPADTKATDGPTDDAADGPADTKAADGPADTKAADGPADTNAADGPADTNDGE